MTEWGALTPRQQAKVSHPAELNQRRLLRLVERMTGQQLPASEYGVVVIDAAKPQQDISHEH